MSDIIVYKKNDVHLHIDCDRSIAAELSDFFAFYVEGYKWNPKYKAGIWDGKIRLYSTHKSTLYVGLIDKLEQFATTNDYSIEFDPKLKFEQIISPQDVVEYVKSLDIHSDGNIISARDYQLFAIWKAINYKRSLILSPTSSGKSLVIYSLIRWYLSNNYKKILIVVPTIGLVTQMQSDFKDYSSTVEWDADQNIYMISGGVDKKNIKSDIVISTWQSIYKMPKSWFAQFGMVIGDEAHQFKAKSLTDIMSKMTDCPYKIGTTGTTGSKTVNKLVLEGLFGKITKVISTKELMDRGQIAKMEIQCISIDYSDEDRKNVCRLKYQDEIKWITYNENRTKFIANMGLAFKENSLILFNHIAHGKSIYQSIVDRADTNRKVFLVYGETDKESREQVRHIVEKEQNAIIVASYGTFSTGVNIRNIEHVVFASPSKSEIRVLQSIGRGLRKSKSKTAVTLYDIVDDLSWKKKKNYAIQHFMERINIYSSEKFDYRFSKITL